MTAVVPGVVGALFDLTSDAVVILDGDRVVAWNAPAEVFFGVRASEALSGEPTPLHPHLAVLLGLPESGGPVLLGLPPHGTVEASRRSVDGRTVLLLRDVTAVLRRQDGLSRLAALSRELLVAPPSVAAVLQSLVEEARSMTSAAYSALLLLREGSLTESSHFVYDAPRHLFPEQMPRAVGLLAVPLTTRAAARLDDIVGHPAGVGLPGVHPPIGPLLAVPLVAGDQVLGELAVANPPGGRCFDELDEDLMSDLAAHAAVAVRWAQNAERTREQELVRQDVVDAARHDIRTPLGAGKGYAALLATRMDRMSPEQVATALDGLRSSFDRIESFSARLLSDDRLNAAPAAPRWQEVDVLGLLEQVRRDAVAMTGRDDAVVVHRGRGAPVVLAGDPEHVREVVENLVGNALKYAGDAGPVTVSVRREGEQVRLDVRDQGSGIPEQEQAALFERWSRTDASRAAMLPGLGLGLSIVKRLVLAHGGLLGVSSRPGEGATFWVTFPSAVPDDAPAEGAA
ncbi:MAG: phoR [Frankiales bacterium]|nr:phoR [Frankiales bacterium]